MNIAVCDDEENIRIYMKKLIEMQDTECRILEFSSGGELLQFWQHEDIEKKFMPGKHELIIKIGIRQLPLWILQ